MDNLIKKILREQLRNKFVISEMAKQSYCDSRFGKLTPERYFCNSAEKYVKNEIEQVGIRTKNIIFDKFRKGISKFYTDNQLQLEIKIEQLTELSEIVNEGVKEVNEVKQKLSGNCSKLDQIFDKSFENLKKNTQIYFTGKGGEYSLTNRLDTNYSAIAVLFTEFFSNKGAFDGVSHDININWDRIVKNWIDHSFSPSIKFEDIRPDDEKQNISTSLSSLEFKELARIYFTNDSTFGSTSLRDAVEGVLSDVRSRGFATEEEFESKYLKDKREYINYAKDYGFVDRYLGIDFIYKGKNGWIPVQVKSSPRQITYLIDKLGCKTYVLAEKDGETFKISTYKEDELP